MKNDVSLPLGNQVSNCVADGSGCKQFNPDKDNIVLCPEEYAPVCAEVQIECVTTPCNALKQTFSNLCFMNNNRQAKFLYRGACK